MVRPTTTASAQYTPGQIPTNASELPLFLSVELAKIQAAISLLAAGHLDKTFVAPAKPRSGNIRFADGASWNPGGGKGIYIYEGTAWTLIKAIP